MFKIYFKTIQGTKQNEYWTKCLRIIEN